MKNGNWGVAGGRADRPVRVRTDDDVPECVRVLAEVHRGDGYPVNWPDRPEEWLAPPAALGAWVAGLDGRLVGHISLSRGGDGDLAPGLWCARNGMERERTAVVSRLFVAPRARGYGIGALLMAQAVREAGLRGLHPVLDVVASDTAAAALYERLGWERLATVEQRWSPRQTVAIHCYAAAGSPS
ncbi:GNAT family N-acetyltransferase [Streptomyces sp. NPDC052396]|uniref:GNAT family N-acetyltransferase n=1 Tax=Streptomyces sp. NPDC052396 TaxID=3365689 RepID=UPI0037D84219